MRNAGRRPSHVFVLLVMSPLYVLLFLFHWSVASNLVVLSGTSIPHPQTLLVDYLILSFFVCFVNKLFHYSNLEFHWAQHNVQRDLPPPHRAAILRGYNSLSTAFPFRFSQFQLQDKKERYRIIYYLHSDQ